MPKVSTYPAILGADLAGGDLFYVVDVSANAGKTLTKSELASLFDAAGAATLAVGTHNAATTSVHGIADTSALATLAGSQVLTNKTLTTPTIGSFTNANHIHQDAAGGGVIGGIPQNSKSTAYTTVLADAGKHLLHPAADTTARNWTIDSNANVAYPVGTAITFINQHGAGVITLKITSDTMRLAGTGSTGDRTLAADGIATAVKITSTEWIVSGTGIT